MQLNKKITSVPTATTIEHNQNLLYSPGLTHISTRVGRLSIGESWGGNAPSGCCGINCWVTKTGEIIGLGNKLVPDSKDVPLTYNGKTGRLTLNKFQQDRLSKHTLLLEGIMQSLILP